MPRLVAVPLLVAALLGGVFGPGLAMAASTGPSSRHSPVANPAYAPSLAGKAVHFGLSGFEPDFDPIYQVIVQATLHDTRPAAMAFPDTTLILSAYLESFTPDTTPTLPDLLHPDSTATALGGFLQGKSVLVNATGRIVYKGSMLAEIFQDATEHLLVDLYPAGGDPNAAPIRLQGVLTLAKGGAETGSLRALAPLSRAALAVPRGPTPSWQSVVAGLSVSRPQMMGTAGSAPSRAAAPSRAPSAPSAVDSIRAVAPPTGSASRPAAPTIAAMPGPRGSAAQPGPAVPLVPLGIVAGLLGALLLAGWRRLHRHPDVQRPVLA